jgi:hypothetical protein
VADGDFQTDTGTLWDDATSDRMLAVGSDLIAVGTARNMDVAVTLEISSGEPVSDISQPEGLARPPFRQRTALGRGFVIERALGHFRRLDAGELALRSFAADHRIPLRARDWRAPIPLLRARDAGKPQAAQHQPGAAHEFPAIEFHPAPQRTIDPTARLCADLGMAK